jgi:hypothetical protein
MFNFQERGKKSTFFIILFFCAAALSCSGTKDNDPCADTIKPQVSADITYTVKVYYHTASNPTQIPIANCKMYIDTWKKLCESGVTGQMSFNNSYTNASGTYDLTVGYNLHNSNDSVHFEVFAYPDNTNSPLNTPTGNVENYVTYDEAAALNGIVKRTIIVDILAP